MRMFVFRGRPHEAMIIVANDEAEARKLLPERDRATTTLINISEDNQFIYVRTDFCSGNFGSQSSLSFSAINLA